MSEQKSLVIYYSRAGENYSNGNIVDIPIGNTEIISNYIKEFTGADLFKVETVKEYPEDYMETTEVAKVELNNNDRPEIKEYLDNIDEYDIIYIGSPNWWGTLPMCMFTQLEKLDFTNKIVKVFITHEGSGLGNTMGDINKLCDGAIIKEGLAIHGSNVNNEKSKIEKWIE